MNLKGKTAAILGGGGGIGKAIALTLAAEGVAVFVGDIDGEAARAVAAEAALFGLASGSAEVDISDDASVRAFADAAFAKLGRVDLLFNHAGVSVGGLLEQVTSDDWRWMLEHNVVGLGRSISTFLPPMTEQGGGGWIVNTSSGLGLFHDVPFAAPYIASKAAIIAYSRALAVYVRNRGIGVSVFCPDITATGFLGAGRLKGIPPELIAGSLPLGRMQSPEDAARALVQGLKEEQFLISLVPGSDAKLIAMANAALAPGSDALDVQGRAVEVVQTGRVRIPLVNRETALERFETFAKICQGHAGCRRYEVGLNPRDAEQFIIFEAWESQADVDAHAAAPETMQFVGNLFALGATEFAVEQG